MGTTKNFLDKTGTLYLVTKIKSWVNSGFVAKESGKGLSTNDFTTAYQNKLEGIETDANKTIVDSALSSVSENPVQNKAVQAALDLKATIANPAFTGTPTAPTPVAGTNTTQIATTAFVSAAIATAISQIDSIHFEKVQTLPVTGEANVIYLLPMSSPETDNAFEEWYMIDGNWEFLGTTAVDLSGYVLETDLVPVTNAEIDAMFS